MSASSRPATIPEFIAYAHGGAFAHPLEPHLVDILRSCEPSAGSGEERAFTDLHRAILRRARFLLDPAENTAPSLDPMRPFGTPNPLGDIGDATLTRTWEGVAKLYCEALSAIPLFFRHARLRPGSYTISNVAMRDLTWITNDPAKSIETRLREIGIGPSRRFRFTDRHLALVRSAEWRHDGWDDEAHEDNKTWPIVRVDAKRTYSVERLRVHFGWTAGAEQQPHQGLTAAQRRSLWKTHERILPAFQVFIEHADLDAGSYVLD